MDLQAEANPRLLAFIAMSLLRVLPSRSFVCYAEVSVTFRTKTDSAAQGVSCVAGLTQEQPRNALADAGRAQRLQVCDIRISEAVSQVSILLPPFSST